MLGRANCSTQEATSKGSRVEVDHESIVSVSNSLSTPMLIVMNSGAAKEEIAGVIRVIDALGFRAHVMPGANRTAIGVTGNQGAVDLSHFENLPGVADAIRVTKPYKLITLELRPERTVVDIGGAKIGNGSL